MSLYAIFESRRWCKSSMVYKWVSTDMRESASVSKDIGCRPSGSNGWTRHRDRARGAPNLRQRTHDQVAQLPSTCSGRGHPVRTNECGRRHNCEGKASLNGSGVSGTVTLTALDNVVLRWSSIRKACVRASRTPSTFMGQLHGGHFGCPTLKKKQGWRRLQPTRRRR